MDKTAAFQSGLEDGMTKVALSKKLISRAVKRRRHDAESALDYFNDFKSGFVPEYLPTKEPLYKHLDAKKDLLRGKYERMARLANKRFGKKEFETTPGFGRENELRASSLRFIDRNTIDNAKKYVEDRGDLGARYKHRGYDRYLLGL